MGLEPEIAGGREGGEIVRLEQVPAGGNGRGNGQLSSIDLIRHVVDYERRAKALRRLAARCDELSYDELRRKGIISDEEAMLGAGYYTLGDGGLDVAGLCAARSGEVMAMVEEFGLSVRDRDDYLASLRDDFGIDEACGVDDGNGNTEVRGDSSPVGLHDDMMCHPDTLDAISEGDVGILDETREVDALGFEEDDDDDAISARHDINPSLEEELELWVGTDDSDPDDLADTFDRRVERVLARDNQRYGTDI